MLFKDDFFFLSNFYPCEITLEVNGKTILYKNSEAAFQAQKNLSVADKFKLLSGLEAKKLGEAIPITTENWPYEQVYAMAKVLNNKFKNYGLLFKLKLIKEDIVNDNFWKDTFWGVYKGEGKNVLGKLLMNIRDHNNDYNYLLAYINKEIHSWCTKAD